MAAGQDGQHRWAPSPPARPVARVFVGRKEELDQLRLALDAALARRTTVILLFGEPGIGKTSLAEEVAADARGRGARVLWGHCYDWEGAPPYCPWVQAIRTYVHQCDADRLRSELGSGAADIAQIIPELGDRLPGLPELPRMDANRARFQLFERIVRLLQNATRHQPLVVVLEDLHWADAPSLLLLQFVTREITDAPLLIIGTYRDVEVGRDHPLSASLAELARHRHTRRFLLQGLSNADVARLMTLLTGIEPDKGLVDAVQRETDGNPFFVGEVVRLLVAEKGLDRSRNRPSLSASIPQTVRDVIGRRLDRLSPRCNDVLSVGSVIGREFTLPLLASAIELPSRVVLEALEEAVIARLITEDTVAHRYRFTHALVQETLYADVSASRRLRLHAAVGRALERMHAPALAAYYGELAHHFGAAAATGSIDKAVEYAIKAGNHAMAQLAWETAIQHYQQALHALDLQSEPEAERRCDALLALGSAHYHTVLDISESPDGRSAFLQAAEIAKTLSAFERLARAALGFTGLNFVRSSGGLRQVQLLEDALALAPPGDGDLKARVMARLAVDYRMILDSTEQSAGLIDAALAMAQRLGDPAVLAAVLMARYQVLWTPDTAAERIAVADRGCRAALAAGEHAHARWFQLLSAVGFYEVGDNNAMNRAIAKFVHASQQSGIPFFRWVSTCFQLERAIKEGAYADAEAEAMQVGGHSPALVAIYMRLLLLFMLRREQGRLEEIGEPIAAVIDMTRDSVDPFDRHRGHVVLAIQIIRDLEAGRADAARPLFEAFAARDFADLAKDSYWLATIVLLADACASLGDRTRAALLYDLLLPYADRNAAPASGLACFGAVSYYLGLLATCLSRWENATKHFEQALEMNTRMQARPAIARTQYACADMLVKSNGAGARERARELLHRALDTGRQLGMTRLVVQAEGLAGRIGSPPASRPASAPSHALSPRELQVLALIVNGLSDRQIAAKLLISQRTVTTHVTHIFNKLVVTNRAEAAAFAVRHGLA